MDNIQKIKLLKKNLRKIGYKYRHTSYGLKIYYNSMDPGFYKFGRSCSCYEKGAKYWDGNETVAEYENFDMALKCGYLADIIEDELSQLS